MTTPREAELFDKLRRTRDSIANVSEGLARLRKTRDDLLADLHEAGYSTHQLAEAAGVTAVRVQQVVR